VKVTFQLSELARVVPSLAKRVGRRYPELLKMLKFDCLADGSGTVTGGDGELWLTKAITGVETERELYFCIKPEDLAVAITKPTWDAVSLEIDFDKKSGILRWDKNGKLQCVVIDVEDYPIPPTLKASTMFEFPSATLDTIIESTIAAVCLEAHRPTLGGVFLESSDGAMMVATATDTFRLHTCRVPWTGEPFKGNLSTALLQSISLLSPGEVVDIEVGADSNFIRLSRGGDTLHGALLAGEYPNWRRVVPESFEHCLIVSVGDLSNALDRFMLSHPGFPRVHFSVNAQELIVYGRSDDDRLFQDAIDCITDCPSGYTWALNAKQTKDALKALGGDGLRIEITSPTQLFKFLNPDDDRKLMGIMPLAVTVAL
jgi:DNA polymerase-3 subunit beta